MVLTHLTGAGNPWRCRVIGIFIGVCIATPLAAQTITVVGTRHLTGLETPPTEAQFGHAIEKLSTFEPTQVCVERMSGERIEWQMFDPEQHGMTFWPETHGRPLANLIVPQGKRLQFELERLPKEARREAGKLLEQADALDDEQLLHAIALLVAGYEFHSAVLNWSYLDEEQRAGAEARLGSELVEALDEALNSVHEVYSLGVPLARKAGLRELCAADALEDETRGMRAALAFGGQAVIDRKEVQARIDELVTKTEAQWQPDAGPDALTAMLRYFNSEEFAEADRRLQWETLTDFDNEEGAFTRRLMHWHARTAAISAELFRALAKGSNERVLFIIGSAHRPFTEADLRAQPWVEVVPAIELLEAH